MQLFPCWTEYRHLCQTENELADLPTPVLSVYLVRNLYMEWNRRLNKRQGMIKCLVSPTF